ncbi:hypothetical protein ABEB36_004628 [Hypothenemus hampei]
MILARGWTPLCEPRPSAVKPFFMLGSLPLASPMCLPAFAYAILSHNGQYVNAGKHTGEASGSEPSMKKGLTAEGRGSQRGVQPRARIILVIFAHAKLIFDVV